MEKEINSAGAVVDLAMVLRVVLRDYENLGNGNVPLSKKSIASYREAIPVIRAAGTAFSVLLGVAQSGKRNGDEQERRQWLAELDAALRACGCA